MRNQHENQDASDTKSAFTHAGNMLKELKTTQLSPRNYYELYMKVREGDMPCASATLCFLCRSYEPMAAQSQHPPPCLLGTGHLRSFESSVRGQSHCVREQAYVEAKIRCNSFEYNLLRVRERIKVNEFEQALR